MAIKRKKNPVPTVPQDEETSDCPLLTPSPPPNEPPKDTGGGGGSVVIIDEPPTPMMDRPSLGNINCEDGLAFLNIVNSSCKPMHDGKCRKIFSCFPFLLFSGQGRCAFLQLRCMLEYRVFHWFLDSIGISSDYAVTCVRASRCGRAARARDKCLQNKVRIEVLASAVNSVVSSSSSVAYIYYIMRKLKTVCGIDSSVYFHW